MTGTVPPGRTRKPGARTRTVTVEQLLGVRPTCSRSWPAVAYRPASTSRGPDWFRYWMRRVAGSRGA